jgi:acyl transferase domain-containing protein
MDYYVDDDVCIVGIGCVLPDAANIEEFRKNITDCRCSIAEIPEDRWKKEFYYSSNKSDEDKTYARVAACIKTDTIKKLAHELNLDCRKYNRLHIQTLAAANQALNCINGKTLESAKNNCPIYLGCMSFDESITKYKFYHDNSDSLRKHLKNKYKEEFAEEIDVILKKIKQHYAGNNSGDKETEEATKISTLLTTSVLKLIKDRYDLKGESCLIDAACASSHAAIDIACKILKNDEADLVITGGIDSNLSPESFVLFSKINAISGKPCYPFDKRSEGLSLGEGSVIFILQRYRDALSDNNHIYGIIKACGSASDGRSSSLFSPTVDGQIKAYKMAYKNLSRNIDYIECHGTGTETGDSTELRSLNKFFQNQKIPIGSVKALVGHTKGAAGATGLLKCIIALQDKVIPPSAYIKEPIFKNTKSVYVNKMKMKIEKMLLPACFGISSFGFGNINYHLVLYEFKPEISTKKEKNESRPLQNEVVVVGSADTDLGEITEKDRGFISHTFKIPPKSLSSIDKIQLHGLLVVQQAFENLKIDVNHLDKEQISVISASSLGLETMLNTIYRVRHFELQQPLKYLNKDLLDFIIQHKERFPRITEDSPPGVLNNVIAGRICNVYDFHGKNFNVDANLISSQAAINIACRELRLNDGLIILILCEEDLNKKELKIARTHITCLLLASLSFAKENNLPIQSMMRNIAYKETI